MDLQEAIPKSIATVMKGTYVYVKTDIMEHQTFILWFQKIKMK